MVEDENLVALLLEDIIVGLGHLVVGPFARLGRALEKARHEALDLAVLDVNIKGQQSYAVADVLTSRGIPDQEAARQAFRHVADQMRPRWPKLAAFMDMSEFNVLAHMSSPAQHRTKIHSTNTLERLNKEVKRRADVVGLRCDAPLPNEASIIRLIGAVLLEQNDEWQIQHRYMQVEAMAELVAPVSENQPREILQKAA